MIYLYAFLVGGSICCIGQILIDYLKWTSGHITAFFVVIGAFLDVFNIYDRLIEIGGAGALIPITSFGHSLMHGSMESAYEYGLIGIGMGMFSLTATGITSAIIFSFIFSLIFKPRG